MAGNGGGGGFLLALVAAMGIGGFLGYQYGTRNVEPPPPVTIELERPYPQIAKAGQSVYRISTLPPSAENWDGDNNNSTLRVL